MLLSFILALVVVQTSLSAMSKKSVFETVAPKLRSTAKSRFKSPEDFVDQMSKLARSFLQDAKHARRPQTFVVRLSEDCDTRCRALLLQAQGRYEVIDDKHMLLTTTLQALQAHQQSIVDDFAPLPAEMKICDDVQQWFSTVTGSEKTNAPAGNTTLSHNSHIAHNAALRVASANDPRPLTATTQPPLPRVSSTDASVNVQNGDESPVDVCKQTLSVGRREDHFSMLVRLHYMEGESAEFQALQRFVDKLRRQYGDALLVEMPVPPPPSDASLLYLRVSLRDCRDVKEVATLLASRSEVVWIEREFALVTHNRWARGVIDTGTTELEALNYHGLTGEGEVVGISDTGLDLMSCFFYDPDAPAFEFQSTSVAASTPVLNPNHRKVVQYITFRGQFDDNVEAHGTHVAGTIAGSSYLDYGDYKRFHGMSPDAKIAFFDLGDSSGKILAPGNINTDMLLKMYNAGARIFSNSWGTVDAHTYDDKAVQVDDFMWKHPDALVFFSAGNDGAKGYNTVTSPSTSKNGVSVGASSSDAESWKGQTLDGSLAPGVGKDAVAYFSSRGPTSDGRQKPDLLAPGFFVYSARGYEASPKPFCEAHGLSGTSMASPAAAGFAVKVRQYFLQGFYPSGVANPAHAMVPSGALIKAIMVHSAREVTHIVTSATNAVELTTGYPSKEQGYGRIQLNRVLRFAANGEENSNNRNPVTLFVLGAADPSNSHYAAFDAPGTRTISFATGASVPDKLRVTMSYTDYPGTASSLNPLVNKLSLRVSGGGRSFSPLLQTGIDADNTQVVDIDGPQPLTTYTVTVEATAVIVAPQPFALVVTGALSYLNATSTAEQPYDYQGSQGSVSMGAWVYIIVLACLVVLFSAVAYWVRRDINREVERKSGKGKTQGHAQGKDAKESTPRRSLFSAWFTGSQEKKHSSVNTI